MMAGLKPEWIAHSERNSAFTAEEVWRKNVYAIF